MIESIEHVRLAMEEQAYVTDPAIATAVFLALRLQKPILVEGQAGVGKTEIAKVLARVLDTELIRLQCYEGLDATTALYEWNYPKQMLRIKLEERSDRPVEEKEALIFSPPFLLERPLLRAITRQDRPPVLLIDEVDRADEEFEAFLLEVLSDFQVTIPELGTITATHRPYVILTSNRTRELSDALKRRCLYLWIDYPTFEKELRIVQTKVPQANELLARQICLFVETLREMKLSKHPGIAETLDWTLSLVALHRDHLDIQTVTATLGVILKDRDDIHQLAGERLEALLAEVERRVAAGAASPSALVTER